MSEELTKLEKIALAALQGLLASGHYTRIKKNDEDYPCEPEIKMYDRGSDWKDFGFKRRYVSHAVSDAFSMARNFMQESEEWQDDSENQV